MAAPRSAPSVAPDTVARTLTHHRFRRQYRPGIRWSFEPAQRQQQRQDRRAGDRLLPRHQPLEHAAGRHGGVQRDAAKAGSYFNKIQCFCFTEQRLKPGQSADLPVAFFVDPAINDDPDLKKLTTITLSYTFYPAGKVPVEACGRAVGTCKAN